MPHDLSLPLFSLATASIVAYALLRRHRIRQDTPPGPRKYPIIGNLHQLPTKLDSDFFAEVGKQCDTDILHFGGLGMSVIVLNSYEAAEELLEKRSGIYSGRPHSTMFHELSGWGFEFAMWPYGDEWRAARKLFKRYFWSWDVHQPREVVYVHRLLRQLLEQPDRFFSSVKHLSACITLDMTYGIKIASSDDPYFKLVVEGGIVSCDIMGQGAHVVDVVPVLKYLPSWFPGASFQKLAAYSRGYATSVLEEPWAAAKRAVKDGNYERNFATTMLEDEEQSGRAPGHEELLKKIAGQVYLAGSDTTSSALGTFLLAMVIFPDIQKKAQEELDRVLQGRLPTHQDLSSLPYLDAVILEVLRWRPVLPMGVPHTNIAEDVYNGFHIPVGSTVIPNQRAMMFDERDFPDPQTFKPERFLKDGEIDCSVRSPLDIAFGFGRRLCAGRQLARSLLSFTAASILSVFDLTKKTDDLGAPIEPTGEYLQSIICRPLEFPCIVKPRSSQAVDLIRSLDISQ